MHLLHTHICMHVHTLFMSAAAAVSFIEFKEFLTSKALSPQRSLNPFFKVIYKSNKNRPQRKKKVAYQTRQTNRQKN